MLYLLIYQPWDTCVLISFISYFWSKIKEQVVLGWNKNDLVHIFKKIGCGKVTSIPESIIFIQRLILDIINIFLWKKHVIYGHQNLN